MRIKNVLQYLESTAARLPDKICFSDGDGGESLTFAELLSLSQRIGSALCRSGVTGGRVAILMDRHPYTIAAMLGVVYAGACYVPLDAQVQTARIEQILAQAQPALLLCDRGNDSRAREVYASVRCWEELKQTPIDGARLDEVRRQQIDTDALYVVFTSGSTGAPKGVVACHRSVIDYGEALTAALPLTQECRLGCQSPLCFDAMLKELLSTFMLGATTYLIPRRLFRFPPLLVQYLTDNRIDTVCWVSSALSQLSALGALQTMPPQTLRTVVFGSEVFPSAHLQAWRQALPQTQFYQLYGPTEATGMSCCYHVTGDEADGSAVPIGQPLNNTGVLLLDEGGRLIEPRSGQDSEIGELYLRGSCVTMGYLRNEEQTARAFVQHPLHADYPETVYRTGDLARYDARGDLIFCGRRDMQIKRMGQAVDLSAIEQEAATLPGVTRAACIYDTAHMRLYLAVCGAITEREVTIALRERLPRLAYPDRVVCLDTLPSCENGKVARAALLQQLTEGE